MNVIRLRYRIEDAQRLREHLHLVDGAGYFFFPDRRAIAPLGMLALLEIDFGDSDESTVLRGLVWSRPATGGLWLELPGAARVRVSTAVSAPSSWWWCRRKASRSCSAACAI